MGDEQASLARERSTNPLFKDTLTHMCIQGRKNIIKQVNICIGINSPSNSDSLFLTSTEIDPSFPDLREITSWKGGKIMDER